MITAQLALNAEKVTLKVKTEIVLQILAEPIMILVYVLNAILKESLELTF